MPGGHPGGLDLTKELLALSALRPPARILDLGAGAGESVAFLRAQGYAAVGLDLAPRSALVEQDDLLKTAFADGSFDAVLSECSLFISGDAAGALAESCRVLKPGGVLMISDVFFTGETAPVFSNGETASLENWRALFCLAGYLESVVRDCSPLWKDYFARCLWEGTAGETACGISKDARCGYFIAVLKKERSYGFV